MSHAPPSFKMGMGGSVWQEGDRNILDEVKPVFYQPEDQINGMSLGTKKKGMKRKK